MVRRYEDALRAAKRIICSLADRQIQHRHFSKSAFGVDLIEDAAIGEELRLRFRPTAKVAFYPQKQRDLGKPCDVVWVSGFRVRGMVKVLGDDRLCFGRIGKLQIPLGQLAGFFCVDIAVDERDRWFARIETDGLTISNLPFAELPRCEKGIVFPRDQHIAIKRVFMPVIDGAWPFSLFAGLLVWHATNPIKC